MSLKRDKPYFSGHDRTPFPKRRRPLRPHRPPPSTDEELDKPVSKPQPPPAVVVMGLPENCSVLDLKSRFEIYGDISRIRIDRDVGFITFRIKGSAEAAVAASLDASFGITIHSKKVQALWATDPLAQWREGVGTGGGIKESGSSSKPLQAEISSSRHGRGNKLASAIVNPRSDSDDSSTVVDVPFKGREIVAYDDIL